MRPPESAGPARRFLIQDRTIVCQPLSPLELGAPAFEEQAIREALPPKYRPDFIISVHTGLRWSEQVNLHWNDVDLLSGFTTMPRSKHAGARRVPINVVARAAFLDLAM